MFDNGMLTKVHKCVRWKHTETISREQLITFQLLSHKFSKYRTIKRSYLLSLHLENFRRFHKKIPWMSMIQNIIL